MRLRSTYQSKVPHSGSTLSPSRVKISKDSRVAPSSGFALPYLPYVGPRGISESPLLEGVRSSIIGIPPSTTSSKNISIPQTVNLCFPLYLHLLTNHRDDEYHLIDCSIFNDRCTSTAGTPRRSDFQGKISARDVRCVITRDRLENCHAAHIIPRNKGNNV